MESLAEDQGRLSIGVVLSGTGSDGSYGLKAIKGQCGITFVQHEATAKQGAMPRSAIATGAVDFVLPPGEIARELTRVSAHPYVAPSSSTGDGVLPDGDGEIRRILALLHRATGVDFTHYKQTTVRRRIGRRMIVHRSQGLAEYLHYVRDHPAELQELYRDMLISVTRFFRDPEAFTTLVTTLSRAIRTRPRGMPFRVWVAGCATGEEAYSIAMCLCEVFQQENIQPGLQLFGTDISEDALRRARRGIYPDTIEAEVSPARLGRFFQRTDTGYQISKAIRDQCVFARQDVTRDPPFSHVDLISCRNTLIYLGPALQKSILPIFHYSLNPSGLLFLGPAESVNTTAGLFETIDRRHKLYARSNSPSKLDLSRPATGNRSARLPLARTVPAPDSQDLHKKVDQAIQSRYAPDAALINQNLQILQLRGRVHIYLEPAPVNASQNLLLRARESLQVPLRKAIAAAIANRASARELGLHIEHQGTTREINLEVMPLAGISSTERYYLVVFEPVGPPPEPGDLAMTTPGELETLEQENARLHQELAEAREYLRTGKEEQEAALEEQRATNEEFSSANEELQSINEELGTTKEELQSANEELNTVNEELWNRNHELGTINDDLNNLLLAVDMPIVMVDRELQLRRSNPAAGKLLRLNLADVGRTITAIMDRAKMTDIGPLLQQVNDTLAVVRREFQDHEGCWWSLSMRPYRTADNRIEGIVLSFADVDSLKRTLQEAEESRDYSDGIVETVRDPLLVLTPQMHVERANAAFYRTFQTSREATEGVRLYDLDKGEWNIPRLREMLDVIIPANAIVDDFVVEHEFPRIGMRSIMLNARAILQRDHTVHRILLAMEDVTERLALEKRLKRSNADLESFGYIVAHDLQEPLRSIGSYTELLNRRYQGQLDATADEFIKYVRDGVGRMTALIRDLLAYSRLATADEVVEDVDMNAVMPEVVRSLQAAIAESGASVKYHSLPAIRYSAHLLVQVLQNLVGNSIKYRSDRPPDIWVAADREMNEWVISVHDNGIGFNRDAAEPIFGVFKRLHGREYEGTGIGLAICKRIVERNGGRIWAESKPGLGSSFYFTVPDRD